MSGSLSKTAQRILMCRPTYFQINYSINPWMKIEKRADEKASMKQWEILKKAIEEAGATVEVMEPVGGEHLPDLVFTANAAVVRNKKAFLANFYHKERKGEQALFEKWFKANGFETTAYQRVPHEGAGDALWCREKNRTLFAGVGPRSEIGALDDLKKFLDSQNDPISIVPCNLVDPRFYHIDTCFCPLNEEVAMLYKPAFDQKSIDKMAKEIELIPIEEEDAKRFACNAVVIGKNVIMHGGSNKTVKTLEGSGFKVKEVDMSEYLKSGGSSKCCTLKLD